MKRILLIATLVFASMVANAKKVKFSVDMTGTDLLGTSVNIMGDFQVVAGLATDNFTELTPLTKEGTSNRETCEIKDVGVLKSSSDHS